MRYDRVEWGASRGLLTFSVTNKCSARCGHCLACSGPSEGGMLTAKDILTAYRQAKEVLDIHVVVFTGGEPTLLGEELFDAIAAVSMDGALTRIVTNACWATDDHNARQMIRQLREAGLDEINFSMDDYHSVWVPPENVAHAYRAARSSGFSAVVLAVAEGPKSRVGAEWIRTHIDPDIEIVPQEVSSRAEGPAPAADGTVYEVSSHGYSRVGRARRMRDDLVIPDPLLDKQDFRCMEVMNVVVIDSTKEMGACCGIRLHGNPVLTLGSITDDSFASLMERGFDRTILRAIRALGPRYLLNLARAVDPGVRKRSFYCHICEICEDVTLNPRALAALATVEDRIVADVEARLREETLARQGTASEPAGSDLVPSGLAR